MKEKLDSFICWVAGHNSRSVGCSINDGPDNKTFDLQQCHRCNKCWKVSIDSIYESQYFARQEKVTA